MSAQVRTRFAPSPTGYLHLGNARTALFNWLYARHCNGSFILRIEDTDTLRSSPAFETAIMEDLRWLGLEWDEGPDAPGQAGPYRQSERLRFYSSYAQWLVRHEAAYPCWCTKERLAELKASQIKAGVAPRYDNRCREAGPQGGVSGAMPVIRFKTPHRPVRFIDEVHGALTFEAGAYGDFVIIGSDGVAAYNFAVVVDDALMGITHVIRGDDHLSNTPRQIMLFQALGFGVPVYAHVPLVLGTDKAPLSKRDDAASIFTLRDAGYLPEAVINSIARLGWTPVGGGGDGLIELAALAGSFDLKRLSRSASVFDMARLKVFNKAAIAAADVSRLASLAGYPTDVVDVAEVIAAVRANAATVADLKGLISPFIDELTLTAEAAECLAQSQAKAVIKAFLDEAAKAASLDEAAYEGIIKAVKIATGEKGRRLFMPIRCGLTGMTEGIELAKIPGLLGRKKVMDRLGRFVG
ncbi:MAG: glutamate--tRNA ligase [Deltaproteobacteria bacterium]|nr:glutamate--tRNA ligase [Deltaproteobacteria bacterium]